MKRTRIQVTVDIQTEDEWASGGIEPWRVSRAIVLPAADHMNPEAIRSAIHVVCDEVIGNTVEYLGLRFPA